MDLPEPTEKVEFKLTPMQEEVVLGAIEHGLPLRTSDLTAVVGRQKSAVYDHIGNLSEKGVFKKDRGEASPFGRPPELVTLEPQAVPELIAYFEQKAERISRALQSLRESQ